MTSSAQRRSLSRNSAGTQPGILKEMKRYWFAYLFISPFFVMFALFTAFSLVFSLYVSFKRWDGLTPMRPLGFENYAEAFSDKVFIISVANTLIMMLMDYPLQIMAPLVVAVTLNSSLVKMKGLFRTAYYLPNYTSSVVVALVFSVLFDRRTGLVNHVIQALGMRAVPWLNHPSWSKVTFVILSMWRGLGYRMIIFLAGLQSIPTDLYEAALVDGANAVQTFFRITVPLLRPIILFVMITVTIGSLQRFSEPFLLTDGGPGYSTHTILYYLYNKAFVSFRLGYSSAIGYVLFVSIFVLSLIQLRFGRGRDEE